MDPKTIIDIYQQDDISKYVKYHSKDFPTQHKKFINGDVFYKTDTELHYMIISSVECYNEIERNIEIRKGNYKFKPFIVKDKAFKFTDDDEVSYNLNETNLNIEDFLDLLLVAYQHIDSFSTEGQKLMKVIIGVQSSEEIFTFFSTKFNCKIKSELKLEKNDIEPFKQHLIKNLLYNQYIKTLSMQSDFCKK